VGQRHWRVAFSILLTIAGLCGLLLFGALALLAGVENRLVGWVAVGIALYAVTRTLVGLARA
jgi:predicted membrane protein